MVFRKGESGEQPFEDIWQPLPLEEEIEVPFLQVVSLLAA